MHALAKTELANGRPDVKIQLHTLSAEDLRHPTELVLDKFPGFGIGTFVLRPQSTGSVHIASADPDAPPIIRANYCRMPATAPRASRRCDLPAASRPSRRWHA